MIQINKIKEPFIYYCQKVIPLAFDESLSYYEVLCHLTAKIKEVIDEQNIEGQAIKELQEKYLLLVDYIDHYFDNLDVQEEINNKLDDMAEQGQLTDIIAQYLGLAGVLAFDTVADMVAGENLVNGSICKCLGKITYNDGLGAFYKIRTITNVDIIDNLNIYALTNDNTLVAERIFNLLIDPTNPIFYGADPTGTIDSSTAIQNCLDANINKEITFTCGTYKIETPIEIDYNNKYGGINFNNSKIINETNNDYVIGIGTKNHDLTQSNSDNDSNRFYNITNLKMESNSNYAILIDRWFMNVRFDNIDIITNKNGVQIGKTYEGYINQPSDVQMSNFILTNTDMTGNYEGITIIGTDNKFNDGRIYGFKTGINANGKVLFIQNIHFLACNFGETNLNNSYCCVKNGTVVYSDMCYCDSYPCFIKAKAEDGSLLVTNLYIYSWHNQFTESAIFDFSEINSTNVFDINYKNIRLTASNYPASTQIIKLSTNTTFNKNLINGFNSYGNIRITGVNTFTNMNKDLALAKKGSYANNYNSSWIANYVPLGYLNINSAGFCYINVIDDTLGLVTFRLIFNDSKVVTTCALVSQANSNYVPALALKSIETGLYKVCFAKKKSDLTMTTNVLDTIELIKSPSCYITPITKDNYNSNATAETSVDIISS